VTTLRTGKQGFNSERDNEVIVSLPHSVQTDSGAHPVSYTIDTGGFFPGAKRPELEAYRSPPSSAEVKNT
jgi:hypothetical protein